jgi:hypothetical protein
MCRGLTIAITVPTTLEVVLVETKGGLSTTLTFLMYNVTAQEYHSPLSRVCHACHVQKVRGIKNYTKC